MAHDVFLSYSSKDKPTADAVCYGLESAGVRCWMAPRDILPGQQWASAIVEAIHSSRLMIVVLSTNSNASDQVLREVERSVHRSIPIIPFRIEEFELASAFEYYLSVPHWLDAMTGPLEEHVERLVHTSKVLLEQNLPRVELPTPPPQSAPKVDTPSAERAPTGALPAAPTPTAGDPVVGNAAAPAAPRPPAVTVDLPAAGIPALQPDDAELVELMRPRQEEFPPFQPDPVQVAAAAETQAGLQLGVGTQRDETMATAGSSGGVYSVAAPASGVRRPVWIWAVPGAVVLIAAVFAATRLLQPASDVPRGDATAQATLAARSATPANPATQPPQVASASVQITSSVEGATILVDGQSAGRTPQTLRLQPGKYQLSLQAATYRDWFQDIEVAEGQQLPVQAILDPLPPLEVLEVTDRVMGRNAALDRGNLGDVVRIGTPTDTFLVSDVVNAVVYFRPKTYQIRDIAMNVSHRWQIVGQAEPGVLAGTSVQSRELPLVFTHACALAAQLDPRGSNSPLTLDVLVEGETVARFTFRIAGGNLANAPADPVQACDRTRLPNVVVVVPDAMTIGELL